MWNEKFCRGNTSFTTELFQPGNIVLFPRATQEQEGETRIVFSQQADDFCITFSRPSFGLPAMCGIYDDELLPLKHAAGTENGAGLLTFLVSQEHLRRFPFPFYAQRREECYLGLGRVTFHFLYRMRIYPVPPASSFHGKAHGSTAQEGHHAATGQVLQVEHHVEAVPGHLAIKGEFREKAFFFHKMKFVDEGIVPEQRLAFRFGEKMELGFRKTLFS